MDINFLNGVYYAKTESMLQEDDFNALKRLEKSLFFKYLKTKDYGYGSNYQTIGSVIGSEIRRTKTEINDITKEEILTNAFYIDRDLVNLRIAFKSFYYNIEIKNMDSASAFTKEALNEYFVNDNEKLLKKEYLPFFKHIKNYQYKSVKDMLEEIEKALYDFYDNYFKNKKIFKPIYNYLNHKKVMINLKTFLKFKKQEKNVLDLDRSLLKDNLIIKDKWLDMYEKKDNELMNKLSMHFNDNLIEGIKIFLDSSDTNELDYEISKYLTLEANNLSYDNNSIGSVVYYMHLKELETLKVRKFYYAK